MYVLLGSARNLSFSFFLFISLVVSNFSLAESFHSSCVNSYLPVWKHGEHFFLDASGRVGSADLKQLKIFSQNFENLGIFKEFVRTKFIDKQGNVVMKKEEKDVEKGHEQSLRLAVRIKMHDPDIIIGSEVKDIKAAQDYSREYLDDKYQAILMEGNDERGIDVCFFVKRSLNLDFEVKSYKNYTLAERPEKPVFSRDFPVLMIREAGAIKTSTPLMALFATHYKSRMGDENADQKSTIKRMNQVQASMEILGELQKEFPEIPVMVSGDFNNDIRVAVEFLPYLKSGFSDALDFDKNPVEIAQRFTQYFFKIPKEGEPGNPELIKNQLDVMFVNKFFSRFVLVAGIQRDVDQNGKETPMPSDADQVNERGSDHDGLFMILDYFALLKAKAS